MSVIFSPRSFACSGIGLSARPQSGRSLAAVLAGGAVLLALMLVATIPARAGSAEPAMARSIIGYLDQ